MLKVETMKKFQLEELIERETCKLSEIRDNPEYDNGNKKDSRNRIKKIK